MFWWRAGQRLVGVIVAGQFSVCGDRARAANPLAAVFAILGDWAEFLDRPRWPVLGDVLAQFLAAGVGLIGQVGEVVLPYGVVDFGFPVGVAVTGRVQVNAGDDAVVDG